jgi:hypothetical protein
MMRLVSFVGVCFLLTACIKEVDYLFTFPGDAMAVVARIDPAEGVTAYLTRGVPPLGEHVLTDLVVDDALVEVIRRSGERSRLRYRGDARYNLPDASFVQAGEQYRLEVSHPDYDTIVSEWVTIPRPIENVVIEQELELDEEMETISRLQVSATDPRGENYYLFEVVADAWNRPQFDLNLDAAFDSEFCEFYDYHPPYGIFFEDACFDRGEFELRAVVKLDGVLNLPPEVLYSNYLIILRHIDPTYYAYQLDRRALEDNRGTILEAPSPSTSNVSGGYGVFLASNSIIGRYPIR